jgi:hypothetical protein
MNGVPNEILAEILSKLDDITLVKSRKVCKLWKDLTDHLIKHRIECLPCCTFLDLERSCFMAILLNSVEFY